MPPPPSPIPRPPVPVSLSKPVGAQPIDRCTPQPWALQIIIDTQQIAQRIPFSSRTWAQVATALDLFAWITDVLATGFVVTGTVLGFTGGTVVEEKPIPGGTIAGALAGWWMAELSVRPLLLTGNILASFATGATIISEAKEGETALQMVLSLNSAGVSYEYRLSIGPGTQVAVATTTLGWLAPEAFTSLLYQSIALASDIGWVAPPWGSVQAQSQGFVPWPISLEFGNLILRKAGR